MIRAQKDANAKNRKLEDQVSSTFAPRAVASSAVRTAHFDPRRSSSVSNALGRPEDSVLSESSAYQYHQVALGAQLQHVVTPGQVSSGSVLSESSLPVTSRCIVTSAQDATHLSVAVSSNFALCTLECQTSTVSSIAAQQDQTIANVATSNQQIASGTPLAQLVPQTSLSQQIVLNSSMSGGYVQLSPSAGSSGSSPQFMVLESSPGLVPSSYVAKFHSYSLPSSALSSGDSVQKVVISSQDQQLQAAGIPCKSILNAHSPMQADVKQLQSSYSASSSVYSVLDVISHLSAVNKLFSDLIVCEGNILSIPSSPKQKKIKLDKSIIHKDTGKRKKIVDHLTKKIKLLQFKYYNQQSEHFFLKNGGNIMDHEMWKEKFPTDLVEYLWTNKFDPYDDVKVITDCLTKWFSSVPSSGKNLLNKMENNDGKDEVIAVSPKGAIDVGCIRKKCDSVSLKSEVNESFLHNFLNLNRYCSFITWVNTYNFCWLHSAMSLVVHNRTLRTNLKFYPEFQLSFIIRSYDEAILTLNDFVSGKDVEERIIAARKMLLKVQEKVFLYLEPLIKCQKGRPDSAFCCLLNLIKEDAVIQSFFDTTYMWIEHCENCKVQKVVNHKKSIITINKADKFNPENLCLSTVCHSCKNNNQKRKLIFLTLPACLLFHFENGAGDGKDPPFSFSVESREYQLTGVMILEKVNSNNHFISYIRNPSVNKWLQCNDLNMDIMSFSAKLPNLNLKDVYIYMFEASDDFGTILTKNIAMKDSHADIPCIDISDEETVMNVDSFSSNHNSNTFFSEDKVCAQVHMDLLKNVSVPKIEDTGLCGSNEQNEMVNPFNKLNNADMKGITEPKLPGNCLVNETSAKPQKCLHDPRPKIGIHKQNPNMDTPLFFNVSMTADDHSVRTPVSNDPIAQKWLNDLKSQIQKENLKKRKCIQASSISTVNLTAYGHSSHVARINDNTCTVGSTNRPVVTPVSNNPITMKYLDDLKSQIKKENLKKMKCIQASANSNVNLTAAGHISNKPKSTQVENTSTVGAAKTTVTPISNDPLLKKWFDDVKSQYKKNRK